MLRDRCRSDDRRDDDVVDQQGYQIARLTSSAQSLLYYANNSPVPFLSAPDPSWQGCAFSRYIENGQTDDDADIELYSHSSSVGDWEGYEPIGPEGEPVPGPDLCTLAVQGYDCWACLPHGITPLQNTKSTIHAQIDALTAPDGTTNITQGLAWAWRVLTPGLPFDEADPNPQGKREQAIVLLTDGENFGGSGDGYKGQWGIGSWIEMSLRLLELHQNIKNAGVKIYVIQFYYNSGTLQWILQQVASGTGSPYYHFAPTGAELGQAFTEVANDLTALRISK